MIKNTILFLKNVHCAIENWFLHDVKEKPQQELCELLLIANE
jgi:hypothetical protein